MERDYDYNHLNLPEGENDIYISPFSGPRKEYPSRNRREHIKKLKSQLDEIKKEYDEQVKNFEDREASVVTLEGKEGYNLKSESAADKRTGSEVLKKEKKDGIEKAIVRITESGIEKVNSKMDQYENEDTKTGKPKNKTFIESIEKIRATILEELWMGKEEEWPEDENKKTWWELWLIGGTMNEEDAGSYRKKFTQAAEDNNISYNEDLFIEFTERQIVLIKANISQLRELITHIDIIAEIHPPSRAAIQKLINENESIDIDDVKDKIEYSLKSDVKITILDTGVADKHPLLEPLIEEESLHTVDTDSELTSDYYGRFGHGTQVAGIAAFGDIAKLVNKTYKTEINHKIESVRIPLDEDGSNRHLWGKTIKEAVKEAEKADKNANRIYNLCITGEKSSDSKPTSWSSMIDKLCFNNGDGRLIAVSAGNIDKIDDTYPYNNLSAQIFNPAHAINAICVGGFTNYITPIPPLPEYKVLAEEGEISPHSRSGKVKSTIKPDIVWEAGNVMYNPGTGFCDDCYDGISLVSTSKNVIDSPLVNTCATSVATPGISKLLAEIWSEYPTYKPTTIRALLIHSANWTSSMKEQFEDKYDLLRTCGYGVPDVQSAIKSAESHVTLIAEDEIKCNYRKKENGIYKDKRDLCYYEIPWPKELLLELGETEVELRVTLSYFSEPNPRQSARAYQGAKLDWRVQGTNETDEEFFKRVNDKHREDDESGFEQKINWEIGSRARKRGTVQSDIWKCIASELATCKHIVVYPINGWWKDNKKKRKNAILPFSLIISVKTTETDLDLYNPIKAEIEQQIKTPLELDVEV